MGGTFNPIHLGHTQVAQELLVILNLNRMLLIPSGIPPHKATPSVSTQQRLEMCQLAVRDIPNIEIDTREVLREGFSYTVDTLKNIRQELGDETSLFFCLGDDAFSTLDSWYKWEELTRYANIVVARRDGYQSERSLELDRWLASRECSLEDVGNKASGCVTFVCQSPLEMSSTYIRERAKHGNELDPFVDPSISRYIESYGLYR